MAELPKSALNALVDLSIGGDREAFDHLIRYWHPRWLRFAHGHCDDFESAADAVQSASLEITRNIKRLKSAQSFPAWSFVILRRCCAGELRSRIRHRQQAQLMMQSTETNPFKAPEDPRLAPLADAVAGLDSSQRNLLTLFYAYGLSIAELAAVYGIAQGTVKSRLFTCRETVKTQLQELKESPCHEKSTNSSQS